MCDIGLEVLISMSFIDYLFLGKRLGDLAPCFYAECAWQTPNFRSDKCVKPRVTGVKFNLQRPLPKLFSVLINYWTRFLDKIVPRESPARPNCPKVIFAEQ